MIILFCVLCVLFVSLSIYSRNKTQNLNRVNKILEKESIRYDDFLILNNKYPHNTKSFTQGLFFYNDMMYESTRIIF